MCSLGYKRAHMHSLAKQPASIYNLGRCTTTTTGCAPESSSNPRSSESMPRGFACMPYVSAPSLFWPAWLRIFRPRIESLMRAASNSPPKPTVLLPLLDELLFEIKQVVSAGVCSCYCWPSISGNSI